ncbi:non-ribosomal peptide synthetase [Williamsia muralis]|uniref:Amino acid adenylation domain-containing protein n=1 Tax=Williamsia marianensis TaxID=85044 RepID=A0ABU4EMT0_WILMA|nr:non-ribosomal peptide synthetase [Williamsia muralis]MDV7132528.1 amino acid adenylation domain-containing protein [Williamsia muralis]
MGQVLRQPLTRAQRALWAAQQATPLCPINIALCIELTGNLDAELLRAVTLGVARQTGIAFTRFEQTERGIEQVIDRGLSDHITVKDLRTEPDPDAAGHQWMRDDYTRPLDVFHDRLMASAILRVADDRWLYYMRGHHLTFDGAGAFRSLQLIVAAYNECSEDGSLNLPPESDLSGLAQTDVDYRESPRFEKDRAYWAEQLDGIGSPISLAHRTGQPDPSPRRHSAVLPPDTAALLAQAETELRTTMPVIIAVAVSGYLARISGQDDVSLSLPVAARTTALLRKTFSTVSNVVPVRTGIGSRSTIRAAITSTQAAMMGALRHQRFRFEDMAQSMPRDSAVLPSRQFTGPLLNLMLTVDKINFGDVAGSLHVLSTSAVDDLAVNLYRTGNPSAPDELRFDLEANPNRYSPEELEGHHRRLLRFIREIAMTAIDDPARSFADITLESGDELSRLTVTSRPTVVGQTLPELLDAAAARYGERPALHAGWAHWTYRVLAERSRRLANRLKDGGAIPGTTVAIATGRGLDQVLAFWAVARTGATVLQIDPAHPDSRINGQLAESNPVKILTSRGGVTPGDTTQWWDLSDVDLTDTPDTPIELPRPLTLDDIAYVVYTSGSTGAPKGVEVTHRGLAALMAHQRVLGIDENARVSGLASPAFDASIFEMLLAASGGAALCPAPPNVVGGQELAEFLTGTSITHSVITPSVLATVDPAGLPADVCSTLMLAGEACPPDLVRRWGSDRTVLNLYGPAEATIMATASAPLRPLDEPPVIGTAITDATCYVLDDQLRPVPSDVIGDLYLAGPGLASGYAGQSDLTATAFVANPWGGAGQRMYRTGDRVRRDSTSGRLHYAGRSDDQVQIRGVRIEPGEIAMAAETHPDVHQAVAVVVGSGDTEALALYVSSHVDDRRLATRIRKHLSRRLPTSMWPAHVVVMRALPVTPSGKLDREALPHPSTVNQRPHRAAQTPAEQLVAQVVSQTVGIDEPSMYDDLLALGGSSLDATRISARIGASTGNAIGVREVLEAGDLAELALLVEQFAKTTAAPTDAHRPRPPRPPASSGQMSMILADRLDPGSTANHLEADVELKGALHRDALMAAIADVLDRHEALRTIIRLEPDGTAWQDVVTVREALADNGFNTDDATSDVSVSEQLIDPTSRPPLLLELSRISADHHRLAVRSHHAAVDGWSLGVLVDDLATAYQSRVDGHAPSWAPATQYIDATAAASGDETRRSAEQLERWTRRLANLPPRPELPIDRSAVGDRHVPAPASVERRTLGTQITAALRDAATERGISTFAWLHATLAVTLARFTGSNDLVVVVPQAGRSRPELDTAVGMYVNPVAIRSSLGPTTSFEQILEQSADGLAFALGNADVPFADVAAAVEPQRDITTAPLSDVLLTYQNQPVGRWDVDGLQIEFHPKDPRHARIPLQWIVDDTAGGLRVELTYRSDLFSGDIAAAMCHSYVTALAQSLARPQSTSGELVPGEHHSLEARTSRTRASLVQQVLAAADRDPLAPALIFDNQVLTYNELIGRAEQVAGGLRTAGVRRGDLVGVALPRHPDALIAQLAAMFAGAAYVPIDPEYPQQRIAAIIEDAKPATVLVDSRTRRSIPGDVNIFDVDQSREASDHNVVAHTPDVDGDDLAYVIFTSGSTGRPKGVAVTHANVAALLDAARTTYDFGPGDVFSCTHSTAFDVSVFEIFAAWTTGARVVLADQETVRDPQALWPFLREHGVTILSQTPSAFYPLAAVAVRDTDPGALRAVVFAGEALHPSRLMSWHSAFGRDVLLSNMYGITETTVHLTIGETDPADHRSLIGDPLRGTTLLILDRWLQPVPIGVWGELYACGPQVTRGYVGRPGLTAERFVACPARSGGGRMYRSGDIVRRTVDGKLEYRGRSDRQVQVRGFRVEPGDVVNALQTLPTVAEAEVVIRNSDTAIGSEIIAYVRLRTDLVGQVPNEGELRDAARTVLPGYLVPSRIVVVDTWPLNASGKRDLRALPTFEARGAVAGNAVLPVAEVIAEVLGVPPTSLSPEAGLFDVGANSLSAMHIALLLTERTGRDVSVRMVAEAPSIADLQVSVDAARPRATPAAEVTIGSAAPPATAQQRALWALSRIDEGSAVYHLPAVLDLPSEASPRTVIDALTDVVARHEVLRTVLADNDGLPQPGLVPLDQVRTRLAALAQPRPLPESHAAANIHAEALRPFDLATELPWRAELFAAGSGGGLRLLLVGHHVAVDGWSMTVLAEDFATAVRARLAGVAPEWQAPAAQYRDHAWRMAKELGTPPRSTEHRSRLLEHWSHVLDGAPIHLQLPFESKTATVPPGPEPADYLDVPVPAEIRDALQRIAAAESASVFHVLHAALAATIGLFTGTDDIVIGTPTAGRTREMMTAVGMFVQTVVLRSRADPGMTVRESISQSRDVVTQALAHSEVSFEEVKERLAPPRTLDSDAYLDVMVAYQPAPVSDSDISLTPIRVGQARVPLEFTITDHGDGSPMHLTLSYGLWHVRPAMAAQFADTFVQTVQALSETVEPGVTTMHALTRPADHHMPVASQRPRDDGAHEYTDVVERIIDRARETPESIALVDVTGNLTYSGLINQAAAIADELRSRGVQRGDLVAVIADRRADTVSAMLGILFVGGGYVPVDPTYPAERIKTIIADARPTAIIGAGGVLGRIDTEMPAVLDPATLDLAARRSVDEIDRVTAASGDIAYVIYTSGSTGKPKGVMVTRSNMATLLSTAQSEIGASADDVWTWFHSAAFDFSVWEIFGALTSGGRVVVVDHDTARDPYHLVSLLTRHEVTILNQTPTAFSRLVQLPGGDLPESLRLVLFGGEALDPKALSHWHSRRPGVRLVNMYGITETTVHLSVTDVDTSDSRSLIGVALPSAGLVVLDRYLRPQPIGATGELYATGPQVTAGYLGRPDLTATRFVPSPWGPPGSRMYRTGDLARWVDGGRLEYLGRGDQQLKIRGHRIEPGEIAAVLRAQPGVSDAKVLLRDTDRQGDEMLIGYVIADESMPNPDPTSLRSACAAALPAHLVPAQIQVVADWPLTSTGKLDAARLPAISAPVASRALEGSEIVVAGAVADVLGLAADELGPDTNFFEQGGNSLSAARLASHVAALTGADLAVRSVFDFPTVGLLAAYIDSGVDVSGSNRLPMTAPAAHPRPSRLELTPQQQALWLHWQVDPARTDYNLSALIPVGHMPVNELSALIATLVDRHESLRTSFPADAGGPYQELRDSGTVDIDVTAHVVADPESALEMLNGPFDLTSELPWRVALFESLTHGRQLAVVVHHIAVDGESVRILHKELAALTGGDSLPSGALDYGDYTAWSSDVLSHNGETLQRFWERVFAEPVAAPTLPGLRPPARESRPGPTIEVQLDPEQHQRLREQAAAHNTSTFMTVHAALAVLLARLGDYPDVIIGTVVSGRDATEFAGTVGMLARTVLLRNNIDINRPFSATLREVTRADLDSFAHSAYPANLVAGLADPDHRRGTRPVVDVFLADLGRAVTDGALTDGPHRDPRGDRALRLPSRFGLDLMMEERGGALVVRLAFDSARIDQPDAELFLTRLIALLQDVVTDPARPPADHLGAAPGDLDVVPEFDVWEPLPDLLRRGTVSSPAAMAVEDGSWMLTYRDLDVVSTQVARTLIGRGIGPGDVVAICAHRSAWSIIATWATAKTGAAFVTLGVDDPDTRRRRMVDQSGAVAGLYAPGDGPDVPGVDWLSLAELVVGQPAEHARVTSAFTADERTRPIRPDDVAYVIFTSGSTGEPKGVSVTQQGIAPLVNAVIEHVGLTAAGRVLHNYSTSFDAHLVELLPAFAVGATVVVCPPTVIGGRELTALLNDAAITHFFSTPAVMATVEPAMVETVQVVATGGESLPNAVAQQWVSGRRVVNFYGPTEATIVATANRAVEPRGPIPIGRATGPAATYVLDRRLRPVPQGVIGELYLAGTGLARGYTRAAGMTAGRFVADPFGDPGTRMYRTGDLVHRTASGDLVVHGRADEQIKVRGIRLEPAEIDAALMSLRGVERAATGVYNQGPEPVLASWIIADPDQPCDPDRIRDQLRSILPPTHIPTHITVVDHFPVTPSGKLDRRALPAPAPTHHQIEAPRTDTEIVVAEGWADVLGLPPAEVGRHSEFFDSGGTSLSASRIAGRLRQQTHRDVTVRHILDARTVVALAAVIDGLPSSVLGDVAPRSLPLPDELELAYPQQRLWVLNRIDPQSTAYLVPLVLRLRGGVDVDRLSDAIVEVQRRHATLRTVYPQTPRGPRQQIGGLDSAKAPAVTRVNDNDVSGPIAELLTAPFDLNSEPGFRSAVVVAGTDTWLVLAMHHVATDGWSMRTILADLVGSYAGSPAPAAELTYSDFTQWQAERLGDPSDPGSRYAQQLAFWRQTLAGVDAPYRVPGLVDNASATGGAVNATLGPDTLEALNDLGHAESATLFHLAHVALTALLAQHGSTRDLVIGTPVLGRDDPAWERVVGMFVNTIALRTPVDVSRPIRAELRTVRDADLAAQSNADVPYDAVVRAVTSVRDAGSRDVGSRDAGRDPLISVLLVHQEALGEVSSGHVDLPGVDIEIVSDASEYVAAKFDLEMVLASAPGGGLALTLVHGAAVPERVADALLEDYLELLHAMVSGPDDPFPSLSRRFEPAVAALTSEPTQPVPATLIEQPSALEPVVAAAFSQVLGLGINDVGRDNSFFDLGGSSLSATQVVAIIADETGTAVPVRHLFTAPSVAVLAALLSSSGERAAAALPPLTGPGAPPDLGPVPLSPAQQRLWLVQRMIPERPLYAVPVVVAVPAGATHDDVVGAWQQVVGRHAPLRTIYPDNGGAPEQRVVDQPADVVDLGERDLAEVIGDLLAEPFDLERAVPVRSALVGTNGHRFVVVVAHHIAMDGQSVQVLRRDLESALAGDELPPLPVQYPQVARWQHVANNLMRSEMLDFWAQALRGYPGVLELPDCGPRDAQRSLSTSTVAVPVPSSTVDAVTRTAQRLGVSDFHVYHAALALTLSIACGTDDVAVGTPVSLRRHAETTDMVGMFVSTVALRTVLRPGLTTDDLIHLVRDTDLAAMDNALLPFDEVVAQQDPIREMGRHPVVQVTLSVNDEPGGHVADELSPDSEFDLQLTVGRGTALFTHANSLYDKRAIETLALRWQLALRLVVSEYSVSLETADLRTEEERSERSSLTSVGAPMTLTQMLERSVRERPTAVAADDGETALTYTQLDQWSSVLASELVSAGVRPGDRVAMMLPRSLESVAAFWAIARIAAVYVPIDPRYPAERIDRMIATSGAQVAVAHPSAPRHCAVQLSVPEPPTAEPELGRPTPGWIHAAPEAAAYLLFTSGTTGLPNGVVVSHLGLRNLLKPKVFVSQPGARVAHVASPSFDASILEMVWAFGSGNTLAVVPADDVTGRTLTDHLRSLAVTQTFLTPSVLSTVDESALPELRTVFVGGETCPPELVRRWSRGRMMVNLYGPTETTVLGTSHSPMRPESAATIGAAVPGLQAKVLDGHLRPTPDGAVGELYFTGPALAMGYQGNTPLTASRFVATADGGRMYRTGDLVRRHQSGDLEYLGRADRQVKIRGQRIEPAEVDAALTAAGVRTAMTVLRNGPTGPVLVSYVVGSPEDASSTPGLLDLLMERLPHHLIPAAIVPVAELPRTPVGKLDTAALPEPTWTVSGGAPRTPTETAVVEVFREVLGNNDIGIYDDFFTVGGNSLLLTAAAAALTRRLERPVPVAVLFAHTTPVALAGALDKYEDLAAELGSVVQLSPAHRAGTPLWCIHPVSGLVNDYRPLGRDLPTPVFGLQMPGLDDVSAPHLTTIEAMAAAHVDTLKRRQPNGPYRLLGWSLGAVLAHEMTKQLTAVGDSVDLLVLLDPRVDPDMQPAAGMDETLERSLRAIDAARFEQYRIRCEEAIAAAAAYEPDVAAPRSAIIVAAQDNPHPDHWRSLIDGRVTVENIAVAHHAMGAEDAMSVVAQLTNAAISDLDDNHENIRSTP